MTAQQLWRFIQEAKIMNHHFTLASFNRLFVRGKKNNFELTCNFDQLKWEIQQIKKSRNCVPDF